MLQFPTFVSTLHRPALPYKRRTLSSPLYTPFISLRSSSCSSSSSLDTVTRNQKSDGTRAPVEIEMLPNALKRKRNPNWRGGFSLGIDLGSSRTGVALSKGFSPRPLTVLELRGQKLELRLLGIAEEEEVDEFIIGLPKSFDGKETPQSNKVRSITGRLAVQAAERGCRVYLQDEHGTSAEALDFMIDMGFNKSTRQGRIDAYAAVVPHLPPPVFSSDGFAEIFFHIWPRSRACASQTVGTSGKTSAWSSQRLGFLPRRGALWELSFDASCSS